MFTPLTPEKKQEYLNIAHSVFSDLNFTSWLEGYLSTARYYNSLNALPGIARVANRFENLTNAINARAVPGQGLILEFGVSKARTTNHMADLVPNETVHGFDSFEGIPEPWHAHPAGMYTLGGALPEVRANVKLHKGWFNETLPGFLAENPGPVSLLHIDCDLYSSTKYVFDTLADRIGVGTVIVFDEYWNYASWELHEHKAFQEFVTARGATYEWVSFVPTFEQTAVRITGVAG